MLKHNDIPGTGMYIRRTREHATSLESGEVWNLESVYSTEWTSLDLFASRENLGLLDVLLLRKIVPVQHSSAMVFLVSSTYTRRPQQTAV